MPGSLEGDGQTALVLEAAASALAAFNFAIAIEVALQQLYVFVVDDVSLFGTEPADFFTVKISH